MYASPPIDEPADIHCALCTACATDHAAIEAIRDWAQQAIRSGSAGDNAMIAASKIAHDHSPGLADEFDSIAFGFRELMSEIEELLRREDADFCHGEHELCHYHRAELRYDAAGD